MLILQLDLFVETVQSNIVGAVNISSGWTLIHAHRRYG